MKKVWAMIGLVLLSACGEGTPNEAGAEGQEPFSVETTTEGGGEAQSVEARIAEIKALYTKIQKADKSTQKCTLKKSTTMDGLDKDMQFPFENSAEECTLSDGLKYRTLELNGYEFSEECRFYYADNTVFFVLLEGGAEACAFVYRIYYDKKGKVIRVLSAENGCTGDAVGESLEVTDPAKRKEILGGVEFCAKRFAEISGK